MNSISYVSIKIQFISKNCVCFLFHIRLTILMENRDLFMQLVGVSTQSCPRCCGSMGQVVYKGKAKLSRKLATFPELLSRLSEKEPSINR